MEQKMITIPFNAGLAKKIQAGNYPGSIITRDGDDVRILCWDLQKDHFPIIAVITTDGDEDVYYRTIDGRSSVDNEEENSEDLVLLVPEWTQFKDGDILATENGSCCILNANGEFKTSCYAGVFQGKLAFGGAVFADCIEIMTYATEEQKQQLIDALKQSTDPRAKEYLKRFFGIEEKQECEFEPFQKVLVRDNDNRWCADFFSHLDFEVDNHFICVGGMANECIPYTDQTKHLLGTTDNWEEQQ